MSKYIKLEDAIRKYAEMFADEAYWEHGVGDGKPDEEDLDIAREYYSDLPTIEVSEEVLKATKNFNAYTIADKNADMGMRTQIEPIIEVSEDCISREYLKSFEYINKGDFNSVETIREWIDNAPSVVPTTEQSSMVGEWIEKGVNDDGTHNILCSCCRGGLKSKGHANSFYTKNKYKFCYSCGAKMKV